MKIQYKLAFLALGLLGVTSCAKHDPLADIGQIGQEVPTCFWSIGSSTCKAGEEFSFRGQYYTALDATPDHSEIWYLVKRDESASATCYLAGSGLRYTKTVAFTDTVRDNQRIASFPHSEESWDGTAYVFNATVPTSSTLSPVTWANIRNWDQERFDDYYPQGFAQEFVNDVITQLTADSTYYNALRTVYINYNFSNDQFKAANEKYGVNFPTDIAFDPADPQSAVSDKSDRWYQTTEADPEKVIGWYYKTVDGNGNTVIIESKSATKPDETHNWFPVYDSAPWVFCRYDDDAGAIVRAVRAEYIPAFKDLLSQIAFQDWIYNSAESAYAVTFLREYKLDAQFKVFDSKGNVGTAYDVRTINLN